MKETAKSKQKKESHEKILKAAGELFKKNGFTATGVDELMEKAGLTAGAFYAHFDSKSDLLDQTLLHTLEQSRHFLTSNTENLKGKELIESVLKKYVSRAHRDNPQVGCPLPAIASEIYRNSTRANKAIQNSLEKWIHWFEKNLEGDTSTARERSMRLVSQAVGAILLSRIVASTPLSDEILKASQQI